MRGEDFSFAPGTGFGGGFGGGARFEVEGGEDFLGEGLGVEDFGAMVRRDSFSGERVGVRFFLACGDALGGERLALARIDRSGGGRGARGAAQFGAGGCLTMLLAEAFSVVALRHGECLPGDAMRLCPL